MGFEGSKLQTCFRDGRQKYFWQSCLQERVLTLLWTKQMRKKWSYAILQTASQNIHIVTITSRRRGNDVTGLILLMFLSCRWSKDDAKSCNTTRPPLCHFHVHSLLIYRIDPTYSDRQGLSKTVQTQIRRHSPLIQPLSRLHARTHMPHQHHTQVYAIDIRTRKSVSCKVNLKNKVSVKCTLFAEDFLWPIKSVTPIWPNNWDKRSLCAIEMHTKQKINIF